MQRLATIYFRVTFALSIYQLSLCYPAVSHLNHPVIKLQLLHTILSVTGLNVYQMLSIGIS